MADFEAQPPSPTKRSRGKLFPTPFPIRSTPGLLLLGTLALCVPLTLHLLLSKGGFSWYTAFGGGAASPRLTSCTIPSGGVGYARRSSLPMFFFVAGVEGGGHDFVESVFNYLPVNVSMVLFEPGLHLTSAEKQTRGGEDCPAQPYSRNVNDFGTEVAVRLTKVVADAAMKAAGDAVPPPAVYVRARDPFSMGRVRTPLARADLVNMAVYDGIQYKLKVISLTRNLTEAILWSVSRNFHADDLGLQVRLIEDSLVYLDTQLRMLPCASHLMLDVNEILDKPESVAGAMADFMELDGVSGASVLKALRAARTAYSASPATSTLPLFNGETVENFFASRSPLWPLFSAARGVPYFKPSAPTQWPRRKK
eukprot:TRINITY_DN1306_c0_g1_i1.p1 TRINITY_DN1306_c0_g1~~TRINITY_DN1306_c0_g1_i1.p1  ORF type:complete len:366 (+),score=50.93 TRINITY_DN1306_c0_g1_i1:814-1911(+)